MKKRILLTNDDGVAAPGLRAVFDAIADLGDVTVVAPADQRSGASHHITLEVPLRARKLDLYPGWEVDFTPVDCVKLALKRLLPAPPDLVVSGINRGSNAGILAHYSGTVGAAIEAAMVGIPALAFSLCGWEALDFGPAARVARDIVARALEQPLPAGTVLNVNVPARPIEELRGVRWCRQGLKPFKDEYDERVDPRGTPYYWLAGSPIPESGDGDDDDLSAVRAGFVAVTPLTIDWTCRRLLAEGPGWLDPSRGGTLPVDRRQGGP